VELLHRETRARGHPSKESDATGRSRVTESRGRPGQQTAGCRGRPAPSPPGRNWIRQRRVIRPSKHPSGPEHQPRLYLNSGPVALLTQPRFNPARTDPSGCLPS
jgi:hypothetical protein